MNMSITMQSQPLQFEMTILSQEYIPSKKKIEITEVNCDHFSRVSRLSVGNEVRESGCIIVKKILYVFFYTFFVRLVITVLQSIFF